MANKRVLIGGPLRQEPKILKEHLKSLDELNTDGLQVDRFYVVNDCPEALPLLKKGEFIVKNTGDHYKKTDKTHVWTPQNLDKMSQLRNIVIEVARMRNYDYLLFCDTDLVIHPETLQTLIRTGKDIVAEVFWTKSDPDEPWIWANAWDYDQTHTSAESVELWMKPGTYPVGGTGALMLLSRKVLENDKVNYSRIYNIRNALYGEDRWFMIRAAVEGFQLYLNTECPAVHLYRETEYKQFMEERYGANR